MTPVALSQSVSQSFAVDELPGAMTPFARAAAEYRQAWDAHEAACTAYGKLEERVFAGEVPKDDPAYVAALAASSAAADAESEALERLMEAPVADLAEVRVKNRVFATYAWSGASMAPGPLFELTPTGRRELNVAAGVAAIQRDLDVISMREDVAKDCPVADLTEQLMSAHAREDRVGEAHGYSGPEMAAAVGWTDQIERWIAGMKATSQMGAGVQLAIAMLCAERIRGADPSDQQARDEYHIAFEALMKSALGVVGGAIPLEIWNAYVGGDHPLAEDISTPAGDWASAREAFMRAHEAEKAIDAALNAAPPSVAYEKLSADANDVTTLAQLAYARTPPPDLGSLVQQIEDGLNYTSVSNGRTIHDPEEVQILLDSEEPEINYLGLTYLHLLRYTHPGHPLLERQWLTKVEGRILKKIARGGR